MKTIYFDTEFSEGFFKPISWLPEWIPGNKPKWGIELISIGMVDDDGKEYYAINKDFSGRCNEWVRKNVLTKLPERWIIDYDNWWNRYHGESHYICTENKLYKTLDEIKGDILDFCAPGSGDGSVSFSSYYADYDWVLLCTLFGSMVDLPEAFPMFCVDMKQEFERLVMLKHQERMEEKAWEKRCVTCEDEYEGFPRTIDGTRIKLQHDVQYPKWENEHTSISDAHFVRNLASYIKQELQFS